MKRRTIIGIIFIVVALLKLADLWGIWYIDWLWKHPWPKPNRKTISSYSNKVTLLWMMTPNPSTSSSTVPAPSRITT